MRKAWCVASSICSVVLLVLFFRTLRLYNQASSSQALWSRVIKCFDEEPSKVPANKKCPTCPGNYLEFASKSGEYGDSTKIDENSSRYMIRQTISKDDSAGNVVFMVMIQKLN